MKIYKYKFHSFKILIKNVNKDIKLLKKFLIKFNKFEYFYYKFYLY